MHFWGSWTAGYADVAVVLSTEQPGSWSRGFNGRGWRDQLWDRRWKRPKEAHMTAHKMPETHLPIRLWPPPRQAAPGRVAQERPGNWKWVLSGSPPASRCQQWKQTLCIVRNQLQGWKAGKCPLNASSLLGGVVQGNEYTNHKENITSNFSELLFTKNAALINWDFRTSALRTN